MTVLAELRAEVQTAWRRSPAQTVLWLDPQREWERLLDQLATELDFIQLRLIAERFCEAFQHGAWDFNHVSLRLGC